MSTPRDLVRGALVLIGAVATGETPSAAELSDGFTALNRMLDSWSTEKLLIFSNTPIEFPLVVGQSTYTMGVGGDFDTARPQKIERAGVKLTTGSEIPMDIIGQDEYASIQLKSTTSSIPRRLYPIYENPLAKLILWPVPAEVQTLVLYVWQPLLTFTNPSDTFVFPPGYEEALEYNLAMRLAPAYGRPLDQMILAMAIDLKGNIKRMNTSIQTMGVDAALMGRKRTFSILRGD